MQQVFLSGESNLLKTPMPLALIKIIEMDYNFFTQLSPPCKCSATSLLTKGL